MNNQETTPPIDMSEQLRKQLESVAQQQMSQASPPPSLQVPYPSSAQLTPFPTSTENPTILSSPDTLVTESSNIVSLTSTQNDTLTTPQQATETPSIIAPPIPPQQPVQEMVTEVISSAPSDPQDPYAGMTHDPNKTLDIVTILLKALEIDCSDVFIKADAPPMGKVMGKLQVLDTTVLSDYAVEKLVQSLMNDKQAVKFAETQELDMSFNLSGKGRFRVSIYRQRGSIALVMRRIKSIVPTVDQLHLPRTLNDIIMQNRGLILITGATGSGKTSTLAAMLDYRNANSSGHILTIEDPIEFVLLDKGCIVSQREVDVDTLSWDNALKGAMRQAPDVILIGEMRDLRSAKVSMDLAETGHLVLSTLHASNTIQTLERFISIFPREMHEELYLRLSMSLVAIICQRLVKTKDGQGRHPALEILISTPRIKDLIRKGEINSIKEVIAASRNFGMVTFDQSMFDLWKQGIISEEEALNNADSPNNLQLMMKGISYAETE